MGRDIECMTGVDFLPDGGLIVVDKSAMVNGCVSQNVCGVSEVATRRRLNNFSKKLRDRGDYMTTPEGLGEFEDSVAYWEECKKTTRSRRRSLTFKTDIFYNKESNKEDRRVVIRNGERPPLFTKNQKKGIQDWLQAYRRIYSVLKEGISRYNPGGPYVAPEIIDDYLEYFGELSFVDKGIVAAAVSAGHGSGILSSDILLLEAYEAAVKRFSLKNCFICNGWRNDTCFLTS